jgi:hypothetical protein
MGTQIYTEDGSLLSHTVDIAEGSETGSDPLREEVSGVCCAALRCGV